MSLSRWTDKWKGWRTIIVNSVVPLVVIGGTALGWPIPGGEVIAPVIDGAVAGIFGIWGAINVGLRLITDTKAGKQD